jgi:DNA-binding NarL/FixJ family response regulator
MPDYNGFEWLKAIRERGYEFPVIMYSTASNPAYVQKAYQEGADIYFPKPESLQTLHSSLQRLLHLNWVEPQKIKDQYYHNGLYRVFS